MPRFITNLWFDTEAHEAAEYMGKIDIVAVRTATDGPARR